MKSYQKHNINIKQFKLQSEESKIIGVWECLSIDSGKIKKLLNSSLKKVLSDSPQRRYIKFYRKFSRIRLLRLPNRSLNEKL